MMMKGEFNPKETRFKNERNLILVERITVLCSSLATSAAVMVAAYMVIYGFLGPITLWGFNLGNGLSIVLGLASAVLMGWATDYAFSDYFKETLFQAAIFFNFQWLKIPDKSTFAAHYIYKPIVWASKLVLVGLLLWFDIYCIKTSDRPVQTLAKQTTEIDVAAEQQKAALAIGSSDFSDRIKQLEKNIAAKEAGFRNSAQGLALQKILNENPKNGWAKGQIESGIAAATAADRKALASVNKKQDDLIVKNSGIFAETAKQILDRNKRISDDNAASRQSVSSIFNMAGIGMKIASMIVMFILVLSFCIKHPNYDANGDGEITYEDVNESFQ